MKDPNAFVQYWVEQAYGLGNHIHDKPEAEWSETERNFIECLNRWASLDATHEIIAKERTTPTGFKIEVEFKQKSNGRH